MIYLASPYSASTAEQQYARYLDAERVTFHLIQCGYPIFSPIVHCHNMAVRFNHDGDFRTWEKYDRLMLKSADQMVVLMLSGWKESKGVAGEKAIAYSEKIPVVHIGFQAALDIPKLPFNYCPDVLSIPDELAASASP